MSSLSPWMVTPQTLKPVTVKPCSRKCDIPLAKLTPPRNVTSSPRVVKVIGALAEPEAVSSSSSSMG